MTKSTNIDVVGESLPCTLHAFDLRLSTKLALSTDFKRNSSDLARAHEQAAGRAAARDDLARPAGPPQVPGAGDEVGEGVLLAQQLAVLVPRPSHLAAAAHVGDGEPHPTVSRESREIVKKGSMEAS